MSTILRSVWKVLSPVARSSHLPSFSVMATRSLRSNAFVTTHGEGLSKGSAVPEGLPHPPKTAESSRALDAITVQLKAAPSVTDVLQAIQTHLPTMTPKHIIHALRCLFQLQKNDRTAFDSHNLLKDPTFSQLCQNLKRLARALEINEIIEATKVITFLGVPVDSLIVQTMLQLIRCHINNLTIRQILFVDFLLTKFETKNHLVDALKLALPLVFQIHLPLEIDNEDLPLLKDMLAFCCTHEMPDRCINNVITSLLLNDQNINAATAKSIIWSLCQINCTEQKYPTRVQLLHICYDILAFNIDNLSYDDVLRTAAKIKGRILEKHPEYYHEQLMDAIALYVVNNKVEFEKGLLVARVLSRIAHTHLGLTEYLCNIAYENPEVISNARTNILFGFVNCLSNNNFTPISNQWGVIRQSISANPVLDSNSAALPWVKFCLELASLGHYEDKLLKRVFSKEFLDEFLSRENNTLDYLQLFTLNEAVKTFYSQDYELPADILKTAKELYPLHAFTDQLEAVLAQSLGTSDYLLKNVVLPSGIVADLMMVLQNGYPMSLPRIGGSGIKVPIEDVPIPNGSVVVTMMNFSQGCYSLNSNRLRGAFRLVLDIVEKQGFAAVSINISEWLNLPDHEKAPYLLREVGYKCGEIGIKLKMT